MKSKPPSGFAYGRVLHGIGQRSSLLAGLGLLVTRHPVITV